MPAQEWRPSAVLVMLPVQVLDWARVPRMWGLRPKELEQEGRLGLSLGLLLLPVVSSLVVFGAGLR